MSATLTAGAFRPFQFQLGRTGRMMAATSSGPAPSGPVPSPMPLPGGGAPGPAKPMGQMQTENGIQDPRGRTHQLSVSELTDPALNHRAHPDAPMNVTDAINAGSTV